MREMKTRVQTKTCMWMFRVALFIITSKWKYNPRDGTKAILKGKCMALETYIKNDERSQISALTQHLKKFNHPTVPVEDHGSMD